MNEKTKKGFIERIKSKKSKELIIAGALCLIVVVIVASTVFGNKTESNVTDYSEYSKTMETRLENALKDVDGVGKISVIVTVKSGMTTVIAEEKETVVTDGKTVTTSSPVLVSGKPIVLKEEYPEVSGVVIICKGADNISVKVQLIEITEVLFGIDCNSIKIVKGN